jgi:hypothetical protein
MIAYIIYVTEVDSDKLDDIIDKKQPVSVGDKDERVHVASIEYYSGA